MKNPQLTLYSIVKNLQLSLEIRKKTKKVSLSSLLFNIVLEAWVKIMK